MPPFRCKRFLVEQEGAAHLVGTDSFLLGGWTQVEGAQNVLDIGTGTGVLSLMMAQRLSEQSIDFQIDAVEIDSSSFHCAQKNFAQSEWKARLRAHHFPIQTFAQKYSGVFDLIITNPPYFNERILSPDATRQQARSTVALPFEDLLESVLALLAPQGRFALVLPYAAGFSFCEMATCKGLYFNRLCVVSGKMGKPAERLLAEFSRSSFFEQKEEMEVYGSNGRYSARYQELTKDFYL
jgi:tRNA1Val (adenine37-N6)-methyltransferase